MTTNTKEYYKEIAEKVESGEFFIEARHWYIGTYLNRFVERSYLVLILIMLLTLMGLTMYYYVSILPIKKSIPIQVEIKDASEESTRISYMGSKKKDFSIDEILIKYFSARFVEALESYDYREDFKKLKKNQNIINALGNPDIKAYYEDLVSLRSGNSLILKYKKNVIREIFIDPDKIEMAYKGADQNNNDIKKYEVSVNFAVKESSRLSGVMVSSWQAKIGLSFENITYNYELKDYSPLNFVVTGYRSLEVQAPVAQPSENTQMK